MNYHEDLLRNEEEYHEHRCQRAVDQFAAELHQFEHPDAASEWIADRVREITGSSDSLCSQWLREMLEEQGCIPEEVYHAHFIQPQDDHQACQEPQAR